MRSSLKWNFSSARSTVVQAAFERALRGLTDAGFACAVIQVKDAAVLHLHPTAPPDLATLPQAATTCQHFLKLKSGDLALVNDPSSGSFSLSTYTCVTLASLPDGDLLIAARFETARRLGSKVDEEGVRVPPMPIGARRVLNKDILTAMSMHPMAPADLSSKIQSAALLLFEAARSLEALSSMLNAAVFERYLEDSSAAFETSLAKLPLGTAIVTGRVLGSNEQIKLTLELTEKHVLFDFKGTETSTKVGLSELTTLGTCIWSVLALLGEDIPLTSSVLGHFQVSAPTNSLLASRTSPSLERALSLVVPLLGELVHAALAKINPTLKRAVTAGSDALAQLEFDGNRVVMLSAAPGGGALSGEKGQDAFGAWNPQLAPRIEKSESSAFTWTAVGVRTGTGGKGVKRGGDAELIACRVNEPAKLKWFLGRSSKKCEGAGNGRAGSVGEIEIIRASGTKEKIDSLEGAIDLLAGDEVRLNAAGGGAWGEPAAEAVAKEEA